MLSHTCKYGIRAVLYLAQNVKNDEKIGIKKISEDLKTPTPFLGKILQLLAKQKLLSSTKGPHGGFGLARDPYEITLYELVKIIDGTDLFDICLIGSGDCDESHSGAYFCPIHETFSPLKDKLIEFFKNETIGKLVENIEKSGKKIRI